MASIAVSSSLGPDHVVVVARRELDVTGATRFARAPSVTAASGSRVIVDLAGLAFMDSRGLSALESARGQARQAGGDLVLAPPQQPVARLLSLIDLTGLLPLYASVAEAADGGGRAPAPAGPEQADGEVNSADGEASPAGPRYLATALRMDRGGRDNRPGRLINWLTDVARSVAVQLELLLRPDLSLEPFGPAGPSAPSTTKAI
jgi:anti-sigma B factor antagonist